MPVGQRQRAAMRAVIEDLISRRRGRILDLPGQTIIAECVRATNHDVTSTLPSRDRLSLAQHHPAIDRVRTIDRTGSLVNF